jgi:integral membrane protein
MKLSSIAALRMLALTEGVSFLVLLFIAMPLKYWAGFTLAVKYVGWIHGLLFIGFALLLAYVFFKHRWPFWRGVLVFLTALIPFGPFLMDRSFKKWENES